MKSGSTIRMDNELGEMNSFVSTGSYIHKWILTFVDSGVRNVSDMGCKKGNFPGMP